LIPDTQDNITQVGCERAANRLKQKFSLAKQCELDDQVTSWLKRQGNKDFVGARPK
jgi:hypothetical protein